MENFRPGDADAVREIVAAAAGSQTPLSIRAGGSKAGLGYKVEAKAELDLSGLTGILDYEPSELFLTARAGTPLSEITELLDRHDQMLAFEPCAWAPVMGAGARPTLGGTIACNVAGPRRLVAGAPRDHFLGFAGINGRGEAYKAGAKVVKNVTGYDVAKLMAGAMGTLSVLTEITVKVLPKPETSCTLAATGLGGREAVALMAAALNGPNEITAAAHVPAAMAKCSPVPAVAEAEAAVTALRLEGPEPSVKFRLREVEALLKEQTARLVFLSHEESRSFWQDIGAAASFVAATPSHAALWRVCTTPSAAPDIAAAAKPGASLYDWAGGLLWLAVEAEDGAAWAIRDGVARHGGHATLMRALPPLRESVPLFQPAAPALDRLHARVKQGFDPLGILNPGRMQRGL